MPQRQDFDVLSRSVMGSGHRYVKAFVTVRWARRSSTRGDDAVRAVQAKTAGWAAG
jgi:hypothetical protein